MLYDPDGDLDGSYIPIMTIPFYGHWNISNKAFQEVIVSFLVIMNYFKQFDYFNQQTGYAEFRATVSDQKLNLDDNVTFLLYNGQYKDQKGVMINFVYNNKTDFNPANS